MQYQNVESKRFLPPNNQQISGRICCYAQGCRINGNSSVAGYCSVCNNLGEPYLASESSMFVASSNDGNIPRRSSHTRPFGSCLLEARDQVALALGSSIELLAHVCEPPFFIAKIVKLVRMASLGAKSEDIGLDAEPMSINSMITFVSYSRLSRGGASTTDVVGDSWGSWVYP